MKTVTRSALASLLDDLARTRPLYAPRQEGTAVVYRRVASSDDVAWEFGRPTLSVKEVFLPASDRLLTIERTGQTVRLLEAVEEGERVVFGVRPCDARGLRALDAWFSEPPPDPAFARRRAQTTLIGVACAQMGATCFCTSVGGAPDDPRDVDILLHEVDGGYAVQVVTERGASLASRLSLNEVEGEPGKVTPGEPVPVPDRAAWPARFGDNLWSQVAERCLSCRICTYVCPTCRCFTVRDEALPSDDGTERFERLRCWDACTSPAYRRIAGGHDPRSEKGQRLRNRFFCKFYVYPERLGLLGCTGCGRCIDACPVNIDITEVLAAVHAVQG